MLVEELGHAVVVVGWLVPGLLDVDDSPVVVGWEFGVVELEGDRLLFVVGGSDVVNHNYKISRAKPLTLAI